MQPTVRDLRAATNDLASVTPRLARSFEVLNRFFNELAYDPPGAAEPYLFWSAWGAHAGATMFRPPGRPRADPARDRARRLHELRRPRAGIVLGNPQLGLLTRLLNLPPEQRGLPQHHPPGTQSRAVIKQAPSLGRIFAMVAFALSCFGILVFLWLHFGGSVPLQPKGYRVHGRRSRRPRSSPRRPTCASPACAWAR